MAMADGADNNFNKLRVKLWIAVIILIPIAGSALYTWVTLTWNFSTGKRTGYVQKLSKNGWVCKTWEGEMAMVTMPGAIPEKFFFSIRDDNVAARINKLAGKRVSVVYEQHKGVPTTCFGETLYYVVDVKAID
jgi:hypothetical protein